MFSAGRCVFWCPLAGAESDFCGRNGRWKSLIFRHTRVFVQNQGTVLKKSSLRRVHPGGFPSRQGENERRPISCAHSSWIKRSTLLCRKMTRVHPVVSFPLLFLFFSFLVRKVPFAGIELTSQRVRGLRGTSELPGRPMVVIVYYYVGCKYRTTTWYLKKNSARN